MSIHNTTQVEPSVANSTFTTEPAVEAILLVTSTTSTSHPASQTQRLASPIQEQSPPHDVGQPLQAAQVSDTLSPLTGDKVDIVPLDGGVGTPHTPAKSGRKMPKKNTSDNKPSFRSDAEIDAIISAQIAAAGGNKTDAIRSLILAGAGKAQVIITPKTSPNHLEALLSALLAWQRSVYGIRSRLNAPMPLNQNDEMLIALVNGWRSESERLLQEIPILVKRVEAELDLILSLSADETREIISGLKNLKKVAAAFEKNGADPAKPEQWERDLMIGRLLNRVIKMLSALGIKSPQE